MSVDDCPHGQSNLDELNLTNIHDCHIHDSHVRIVYLTCFLAIMVLHLIVTYKVFPTVKARKKFDMTHTPHIVLICSYAHSIFHGATYLYKYISLEKFSNLEPVGLLINGIGHCMWLPTMWLFLFSVMSAAASDLTGAKGVQAIDDGARRVKFCCSTQMILYIGASLAMMTESSTLRISSITIVCTNLYTAVSGGYLTFSNTIKIDSLLTEIINKWKEEKHTTVSSRGEQTKDSPVSKYVKMRRRLRIVGYSISVLAVPAGCFDLSCLLIPLLKENTWLCFNIHHFVSSLAACFAILMTPSAPPTRGTRLTFWNRGKSKKVTHVSGTSSGGKRRGTTAQQSSVSEASIVPRGREGPAPPVGQW